MVPETEQADAFTCNSGCAQGVISFLPRFRVPPAIQLNGKPVFVAVKIKDITTARVLPSELKVLQPTISKN